MHKLIPHTRLIVALCAVTSWLLFLAFGLNYRAQPLNNQIPNQLAGVNLKAKDKNSARSQLIKAAEAQQIVITVDDTAYTFSPNDLGIKRDITGLLDANFVPTSSMIEKLATKPGKTTGLKTYVNKSKLSTALNTKLGDTKQAVDASVTVDGSKFVVQPGRNGVKVSFDSLVSQLEQSNLQEKITLSATVSEMKPEISDEAATAAKAQAETFLTNQYGVTTPDGNAKQASSVQKASWLVFTPDTTKHSIAVTINDATAKNTLTQLAHSYNRTPVDRTTLTLNGGAPFVVDAGQEGISVDPTSLTAGLEQFETALSAKQSFMLPITLAVQPVGDHDLGTIDGGKFVLVDVPTLHAYAMENSTVVRTMLVSTGIASMPTPAGHFKVLRKVPLLTMTGCNKAVGCWTVPNVPNVQFFTGEGHALHGTYWHNNFGKANMSHGCVNLSLADAAWLFDWTEVGTDVVILRA